jgi:hypothetical protein
LVNTFKEENTVITTATAAGSVKKPFEWTRTMTLDTLWAGCAVFAPLVVIASVAVEAVPHVRGIAFVPQLRYALMTPACGISAIAAAFLYRFLKERSDRPQWVLSAFLFALAILVLTLMGTMGPAGLVEAASPAVLAIALALALLASRFVERPLRPLGKVITMIIGVPWIVGVVAALASERSAPSGPDGTSFDVPRTMFDAEHKFVDLESGARVHYVDVVPATRCSSYTAIHHGRSNGAISSADSAARIAALRSTTRVLVCRRRRPGTVSRLASRAKCSKSLWTASGLET